MLAAESTATQMSFWEAFHYATIGVGAVVALGYAVWLWRNGQWRRPFAGRVVEPAPLPPELALVMVAAPLLAYVLVTVAAQALLIGGVSADAEVRPGDDTWHRLQAANSIGLLVGSAAAIVLLRQVRLLAQPKPPGLGIGGTARVGVVGLLATTGVCLPLLGLMHWLAQSVGSEPPEHPVIEAFHESAWGDAGRWQLAIAAVVIAPLAEELFFRGVLLQLLARASGRAWFGVFASGVLFGLIHLSVPATVLPLIVLGLILGYVRVRTASLTACVVLHALFNARTICLLSVAPELLEG